MSCGGEVTALEKIDRLASYLSEGLPRYQDILEQQKRKMPEAPEGIEYKDPGIMESQIFTVLTKRFKSGRLSFSKYGATCLAKICAIKVEDGSVEIQTIEQEIPIDKSIDEYMKEIKEALKQVPRKHIILEQKENCYNAGIKIDSENPIYQAIQMTPMSELDFI